MKGVITNKYLSLIMLSFVGALSLAALFILPHSILTDCINIGFVIVLPGWMITRLWKDDLATHEKFLYSVTLSLCFLYVCGLLLDTVLPLFDVLRPLSIAVIKPTLWLAISLLSIYSLRRKKFRFAPKRIAVHESLLLIGGLLISVLVVFGANRLNTLPQDWFASLALFFVLFYALVVAFFTLKYQSQRFLPVYIFFIAISLLWEYSLRSHYVFGSDITREFYFFTKTLSAARWTPSKDPYNDCLSLTILPTLIANYTRIGAEFIFKTVYPALFALVPVAVYSIGRRYFSPFICFMGSLFFMAQTEFLFEATALNRQEIALLFLSVALVVFFNKKLSLVKRNSLFLLFTFGMILSHYSTTYVAVSVYLITYLIAKVYGMLRLHSLPKHHISGIALSIMIFGIVCWNLQATQSSTNIFITLKQSVTEIPQIFQSDAQRSDQAQQLVGGKEESESEELKGYVKQSLTKSEDQTRLTSSIVTVPTTGPRDKPRLVYLYFHSLIPDFVKVVVISSLFFLLFPRRKKMPLYYRLLGLVSLSLGAVLVTIPDLSLDYNVNRIYQQALILLAVPTIYMMTKFVVGLRMKGIVFVVIIVFSYLLMTTSLIDRLAFNWGNSNIANTSQNFLTFNTTDADYYSASWINVHLNQDYTFCGDRYGAQKLISFGSEPLGNIDDNLLACISQKKSYIYLDTTNLLYDQSYYDIDGQVFGFTTPIGLISDTRDNIYSNGSSSIYQ